MSPCLCSLIISRICPTVTILRVVLVFKWHAIFYLHDDALESTVALRGWAKFLWKCLLIIAAASSWCLLIGMEIYCSLCVFSFFLVSFLFRTMHFYQNRITHVSVRLLFLLTIATHHHHRAYQPHQNDDALKMNECLQLVRCPSRPSCSLYGTGSVLH